MRFAKAYKSVSIVACYLPSNYRTFESKDGLAIIYGSDNAGWTLDAYVIPRLGSGLIGCREISSEEFEKELATAESATKEFRAYCEEQAKK